MTRVRGQVSIVRKRRGRHSGGLKELGGGRWQIRYGMVDSDGKRVQRSETVRGSKKQAEAILRERLQAVERRSVPARRLTVNEFLDAWLEDHVKHTTRPRTLKFYQMIARLYIRPVIGNVELDKVAPLHVQTVVGRVFDKGLSPSTARRAYATLHRAFVVAVKLGVVYRNPCDAVDAPREAEREIHPPSNNEVKQLLEGALKTPYGAEICLLASSGMRRGEVGALMRDGLDLEKSTVSISQAVARQDGKLTLVPVKSRASRRMIYLDAATIALLRRHLVRKAEHQLAAGPAFEDMGLLFPNAWGGLRDPDALTKTWRRLCREAGVRYRLHDLRHHHASALIEAGVHIKAIQTRLGHSSPSLTMAVYSHVTPGMDRAAAEAYAVVMNG